METSGPLLAFDLFGRPKSLGPGARISLPGDAVLELQQMREERALDLLTVLHLGLDIGKNLAEGLVAAWLYDKLKGRVRSLRINRVQVDIDKGDIERVLIEQIKTDE